MNIFRRIWWFLRLSCINKAKKRHSCINLPSSSTETYIGLIKGVDSLRKLTRNN